VIPEVVLELPGGQDNTGALSLHSLSLSPLDIQTALALALTTKYFMRFPRSGALSQLTKSQYQNVISML